MFNVQSAQVQTKNLAAARASSLSNAYIPRPDTSSEYQRTAADDPSTSGDSA